MEHEDADMLGLNLCQACSLKFNWLHTWYIFGSAMFSLVLRLTESQRHTEIHNDSERFVQGLRPGWPRGRGDPGWRSDWWQPEIDAMRSRWAYDNSTAEATGARACWPLPCCAAKGFANWISASWHKPQTIHNLFIVDTFVG